MRREQISVGIEDLLCRLLFLRRAYEASQSDVKEERLEACFEVFGLQKHVQTYEMAKAFHMEDRYREMLTDGDIFAEVQRSIPSGVADNAQRLLQHFVQLEEEVMMMCEELAIDCDGEVRKFILSEHRKDSRRQVRALREMITQLG